MMLGLIWAIGALVLSTIFGTGLTNVVRVMTSAQSQVAEPSVEPNAIGQPSATTLVVPGQVEATEPDATPRATTSASDDDGWGEFYRAHRSEPVTIIGPSGSCRSIAFDVASIVPGGYRVECVNSPIVEKATGQSKATTSYGVTDVANRRIRISIPSARGHYLETLWHEAGHAIQADYFTHADENVLLQDVGQADENGPYEVNALEQWARAYAVCIGGQPNNSFPKLASCQAVTQIRSEIDGRTGVDIAHIGSTVR